MKLNDIAQLNAAKQEFEHIVGFEKALREWQVGTGRIDIVVKDQNDSAGAQLSLRNNMKHVDLPELREDLRKVLKKYRERVQTKLAMFVVDDFTGWLPRD